MDLIIDNYIYDSGFLLEVMIDLIKCGINRVTDFEYVVLNFDPQEQFLIERCHLHTTGVTTIQKVLKLNKSYLSSLLKAFTSFSSQGLLLCLQGILVVTR